MAGQRPAVRDVVREASEDERDATRVTVYGNRAPTMVIAEFIVDSLSEGDGRCGVSKHDGSCLKKRNALPVQSFWSMRFGSEHS